MAPVAFSLASLMRRAICSLLSIMVWVKLKPLASIALTAWSVTRLTSLTNSWLLLVSAASSPLDFSSTIRVISAARWPTAVEISSALPTKLRATSALTESNVRSTSPAFCLSTLLTPVDMPLITRSASCALERIAAVVVAASWVSERSASAPLFLTAWVTCWMPVLTVLEAAVERLPSKRSASPVLPLMATVSCSVRAPIASTEAAVSFSIACTASPALVLIALLKCSVRALSSSAADWLRASISLVKLSVREVSNSAADWLRASISLFKLSVRAISNSAADWVRVSISLVKLSVRAASKSTADWLRASISLVMLSARPLRRSSKRLMRVSRLSATSIALTPSVLSMSSILAPMCWVSWAPRADEAGAVGHALVERADHFVPALGHPPGDVHDARGQRLAERLGPAVEGVSETIELLVEACRDLGRLDRDAGVEIVEIVAHRARNVLRALAETFDHFAAVGLHGAVELGKMAGDEIAERAGVARDPFGELGAALIEHGLECLQPCRQQLAHRVAADGDHVGELAAPLIEHVLERLQPRRQQFAHRVPAAGNHVGELAAALVEHVIERLQPRRQLLAYRVPARGDQVGKLAAALIEHGLEGLQPRDEHFARRLAAAGNHFGKRLGALVELIGHPIAALLELGYHVSAAQAQIEDERIAGILERGVDLLDAPGNRLGELVAGLDHEVGQLLRTVAHQIENLGGLLREALGHMIEPLRHRALDVVGDLGELVADVIGLEIKRRAQAVAGGGDRLRGVMAGAFEAGE